MIKAFLLLLILCLNTASADCSSPTGKVGIMKYFSGDYYYCNDGSAWQPMHDGSPTFTACSPAGLLTLDYYCNGSSRKAYMDSSLSDGGACTTNNMLKYFSNNMHLCVGGSWHKTGSSSGGGIMTCTDYISQAACESDFNCAWGTSCGNAI